MTGCKEEVTNQIIGNVGWDNSSESVYSCLKHLKQANSLIKYPRCYKINVKYAIYNTLTKEFLCKYEPEKSLYSWTKGTVELDFHCNDIVMFNSFHQADLVKDNGNFYKLKLSIVELKRNTITYKVTNKNI
jgi:hypothetical protein